jgi:predicted MFS family arabinose efflux permease
MSWVLFHSAVVALYVLFATRDLGLAPFMLGLVFVAGGIGAIPGALLSVRVAQRFGVGPSTIGCWFVGAVTLLAIPLAGGTFVVPILAGAMLLGGVANTIANIQQWSLRQIVTPDELQGRVTASHRFLVYGAMPVGALLGGLLGDMIGARTAILLCAVGVLVSPFWAVFSPLRSLRIAPTAQSRS